MLGSICKWFGLRAATPHLRPLRRRIEALRQGRHRFRNCPRNHCRAWRSRFGPHPADASRYRFVVAGPYQPSFKVGGYRSLAVTIPTNATLVIYMPGQDYEATAAKAGRQWPGYRYPMRNCFAGDLSRTVRSCNHRLSGLQACPKLPTPNLLIVGAVAAFADHKSLPKIKIFSRRNIPTRGSRSKPSGNPSKRAVARFEAAGRKVERRRSPRLGFQELSRQNRDRLGIRCRRHGADRHRDSRITKHLAMSSPSIPSFVPRNLRPLSTAVSNAMGSRSSDFIQSSRRKNKNASWPRACGAGHPTHAAI